ncbi:hypothetical protein V3C99_019107, partial [Haemonchus contortus]|uniref:Gelsolin, cytoplasmic n=1 Tax=Haemonchus contortus TaxID=6289 RepID=A0A7I4Z0F0_HAECO
QIMVKDDVDVTKVGKEPGLEVWRVKEFKLEPVPKSEYGQFYSNDTYIVLNSTYSGWDVHFWLGETASLDEVGTAAIKAVEIDQALGGIPVQYREVQYHESSLFLSYFPSGIRYMDGGYESGFHHVEDKFKNWEPRLFHCKGKRNVRCYQVPLQKESLNLGDVFILDLGKDIYVWMPATSGRLERIKGMTIAKHMADVERQGEAQVHILDTDWDTNDQFWSHFGGKSALKSVTDAKDDDENYWKDTSDKLTLWRVSDVTGEMKVTKVAQGDIKRSQLDSKDAFVLNAGQAGIYVWVGKECTLEERAQAMTIGSNFIKEHKLPVWTPLVRVLESAEPASFTQWFEEWVDSKTVKTYEPRVFQVSDESGEMKIEEIANYTQESLDGDDVMILDATNRIYVWVGEGANQNEKKNATNTAEKYLKSRKLPRHVKTEIETIFQGKETPTFKKLFPSWDDKLFQSGERSMANMRKLLFV